MRIILLILIFLTIYVVIQLNCKNQLSYTNIEKFDDTIISILDNRPGHGFFSMFFFTLNHYIYCKMNKINFKIKSDQWLFKYKNGWSDYFTDTELNYNPTNTIKNYTVLDKLDDYSFQTYRNAINDIYIFNPTTINKINEIKLKYNLVDYQYDSIFIRRGDKLSSESTYYKDELYIQLLLTKNPNCNTIFLQTDDYNSYLNLKKYIIDNNLSIQLYTLCDENSFGVIVNNMQKDKLNNASIYNNENKDYISSIITKLNDTKSVEDMNSDEIYKHTLDMIIGIDIINHSNICICDMQSNVARFIKLSHKNPDNVYDIINPDYQIDYNKNIEPWNNI